MKMTTPQPYKAHLTPHLDRQRDRCESWNCGPQFSALCA